MLVLIIGVTQLMASLAAYQCLEHVCLMLLQGFGPCGTVRVVCGGRDGVLLCDEVCKAELVCVVGEPPMLPESVSRSEVTDALCTVRHCEEVDRYLGLCACGSCHGECCRVASDAVECVLYVTRGHFGLACEDCEVA